MKRRGGACAVGLALAACLLVAGCGRTFGAADVTSTTAKSTSSIPPTTGPRLRGGYLASHSNGGIFVQITMTTATAFEGSVMVHLEYRDGPVDERNHLTGVVSRTDVIFRFDHGPDWRWGSSWSGSLNAAGFTMNLPTEDGSLFPAEFRKADVEDYNRAVQQAKP